jgi:hypothetical protein
MKFKMQGGVKLIYIANSFSQLFHPFTKGDGFFFMFYHEC